VSRDIQYVGRFPECFTTIGPYIRMNWITAANIPLAASYFGIRLILPSAPCFSNGRFGFPTIGLYAFVVVNVPDMPSLFIHTWSYYRNSRKYLVKRAKMPLSATVNLRDKLFIDKFFLLHCFL
jgi:hypothetical protein